jgi:hypothetical protein
MSLNVNTYLSSYPNGKISSLQYANKSVRNSNGNTDSFPRGGVWHKENAYRLKLAT